MNQQPYFPSNLDVKQEIKIILKIYEFNIV